MNVISIRSIEIAAEVAADRVIRPSVKAWLLRSMQRFLRKTPDHLERIRSRFQIEDELRRNSYGRGKKAAKDLKDRLMAAFDRGEDLYVFVNAGPTYSALIEQARSVTDWLDAVPEWDRHLRRIDRMSYAEAVKIAESWHARLLSLAADADDPDVVEEIDLAEDCGDGCRFVELKGAVALLREGRLMGHCVGGMGYVDAVRQGVTRIFSFRDAANMPHVTIEVRRRRDGEFEAAQIKGKGNKPPVEGYAVYCRKFIIAAGWAVSYDGNNIGLVTIGGRTYDNADDILNAMLDGFDATSFWKTGAGLTNLFQTAPSAHGIVLRRLPEIKPDTRRRLFDVLAPTPDDVLFRKQDTIVRTPDGVAVERRDAIVPGAFVQALSVGLFAGLEGEVADVIAPLLEAVFLHIEADPVHVWTIAISGYGAGANGVEQIAAFAAKSKRLHEVRERVSTARNAAAGLMAASIRKAAAAGIPAAAEDGDWVHRLAMIERIRPAAVDKLRNPATYVI